MGYITAMHIKNIDKTDVNWSLGAVHVSYKILFNDNRCLHSINSKEMIWKFQGSIQLSALI